LERLTLDRLAMVCIAFALTAYRPAASQVTFTFRRLARFPLTRHRSGPRMFPRATHPERRYENTRNGMYLKACHFKSLKKIQQRISGGMNLLLKQRACLFCAPDFRNNLDR
jgi:hypothetical protein